MVERYGRNMSSMVAAEDGDYVLYSDYATKEVELQAAVRWRDEEAKCCEYAERAFRNTRIRADAANSRIQELEAHNRELEKAAECVVWYDWSDNDADAVRTIDRLRALLSKGGI